MASPLCLGVFPGSFNPPTKAHLALIRAASKIVDRVVAVLPRTFPHKQYEGVTLPERVSILEAARNEADFVIQVTTGGLFIDIAHELRTLHGPQTELWFICGRDAAQRIVEWDYGHPKAIHGMLEQFGLLVAARRGEYVCPIELSHRVRTLDVPPDYDALSATEVRQLIARGEPWEHLVPEAAVPLVRRYYIP